MSSVQPVLLNDFKRQWQDTREAVLAAVEQVGSSGWYILGDSVAQFEQAFATVAGTRFAVGCASGLDAIEMALRALALPAGARVLTTPLSAFATTLAIVRAGLVPVFADVDERGNLDLTRCERILETRPDIACLLPVHLYGYPLDLEHLAALKERSGRAIVEDCAQSVGAAWAGRGAGTVGDLATYSFYPTKNLGAMGDGGAVCGAADAHRTICASLRNYGQSSRYVHDQLGLNSRLDELHAAILNNAFLPRLPQWTARRREVAARYASELTHANVRPLPQASRAAPVWHLFSVLVSPEDRPAFQKHLAAVGVHSAVHYPKLIPDQPCMASIPHEVLDELARARMFAASQVSLPMHPYLSDEDVQRVVAAVNTWHRP